MSGIENNEDQFQVLADNLSGEPCHAQSTQI
jgi:hypothetical protein